MDRLRAMELFLSVSKTRSFSETARRFAVSATAVSRIITDLEDSLSVKLLTRSTRQVVLTESGQEYANQLDGVLRTIEDVHRNITAIREAPKGMLRVHSRMMFGLSVLPSLVADFRAKYPDIQIELDLSEAPVDLRTSQVDIDFRISPPVEAGVKRRKLFHSERLLVAAPKYLKGRAALLEPPQIVEHDCLAYLQPGNQYFWHFRAAPHLPVRPIAFTPRHVTNSGTALLELARLGEGIALLDDYTVHHDLARGSLVRVMPGYQVTNTTFEEGMYATILDSSRVPIKIRLFLECVAERVSGETSRFSAVHASSNDAGAKSPV